MFRTNLGGRGVFLGVGILLYLPNYNFMVRLPLVYICRISEMTA